MKRKKSMDFFVEESSKTDEISVEAFYVEKGDSIYGGRKLHYEDKIITYYFHPLSKSSALVFFYLGNDVFDSLVDGIDEYNIESLSNAWPLLIDSLKNGIDDNYSKSALIKLEDYTKENSSFWCLSRMIENVDFSDLDTEYVIQKVATLYSDAVDLFQEINDNDISTIDQWKGGIKQGVDIYRTFKIAKTVIGIGASILGFPTIGGFLSDNDIV